MSKKISILGVGDLIIGLPDLEKCFEPASELLNSGDIVLGSVDAPHTDRGHTGNGERRNALGYSPEWLNPLKEGGFTTIGGAGNHAFDAGYFGVVDTLDKLHSLGIDTVGLGEDREEARKPALYEIEGIKVAVLNYNCVGPRESWATPQKAGANFIRVITYYESDVCEPGSIPEFCWTSADPGTLHQMIADIKELKEQGYNVITMLHLGNMGCKELLPYHTEITHAAVDAGACAVLCSHAHEPRGIEMYKGAPVFYGLGNWVCFCDLTPSSQKRADQMFFVPYKWPGVFPVAWKRADNTVLKMDENPANIPHYIFSPESRNTLAVRLIIDEDGNVEPGFYPCYINDIGAPAPVTRDDLGESVLNIFRQLNEIEGLDTEFTWSEDGTYITIK